MPTRSSKPVPASPEQVAEQRARFDQEQPLSTSELDGLIMWADRVWRDVHHGRRDHPNDTTMLFVRLILCGRVEGLSSPLEGHRAAREAE